MISSVPNPMIIWRSSRECGLNCRHCYAPKISVPGLTIERKQKLVHELTDIPKLFLSIEGNDPDLELLLKEVATTDMTLSLALSGTDCQFDLVKPFASKIRYIHFSIDGHDAVSHDSIRGVSGDFSNVVSKIIRFGSIGVQVFVTCAVAAWNVDSVLPLAKFLSTLPVDVFCVNVVTPFGHAVKETNLEVPPLVWRQLEHDLAEFGDRQDRLKLFFEPNWFSTGDGMAPVCAIHDRRFCIIDADGSVYYCPLMMSVDNGIHALGSLRTHRLADIWYDDSRWSQVWAAAKDAVPGECLDCSAVLWCRGGCPAFRLSQPMSSKYCSSTSFLRPICCMHRLRPRRFEEKSEETV